MRVLIVGAAGYVGRHIVPLLENHFDLRLADVNLTRDDPRLLHVDVTRPGEAFAAMHGIDAVINLAVASGHEGDYEDDDFNQQRFDVNVRGTFNVLEAARRAGVRRLVHTSSLMVVWGYPTGTSVASDAEPRPVGTYALTKQLGEMLCEQYARSFGLSIVCLRIPKPISLDEAHWKKSKIRPQWLAFPDLAQAYRLALTAPTISFEIVTIVGQTSRSRWDLSKAEHVLGYRPTIRLEELGYEIGDEHEPFPGWGARP